MGYEILGHTADLRLRAWGRTPEELFRDALAGMMAILGGDQAPAGESVRREIRAESADRTALLVDFLNAALTEAQTNRELYFRVEFRELSETSVAAALVGASAVKFAHDVKAVTHHEAAIIQRADGALDTTLVFDI